MSDARENVIWARWSNTLNNWSLCEPTDHNAVAFVRSTVLWGDSKPPAVGPELDKALDAFVADKPKDIMR